MVWLLELGARVLAMAVVAGLPAAVRAQTPVDTALVLAVDASGSIDDAEFQLQKDGIAQAITDPRVMAAIRGGLLQRIAVAYVEWGGPGMAQAPVSWTIVDGMTTAQAFAAAVLAAPRSMQTYNAIGDAILLGVELIARCPCTPTRSVIDISGDNIDNRSLTPAVLARRTAAAAGITVNALAILQNEFTGPSGKPRLVENYEGEVIAGPGAFVIAARDRNDFARALLQKMVLEIAGGPATGRAAAVAQPD